MSKRNRKRKLGSKRDLEERRKDPNAKEKAKALKKQQGSFVLKWEKKSLSGKRGKKGKKKNTDMTSNGFKLIGVLSAVLTFDAMKGVPLRYNSRNFE